MMQVLKDNFTPLLLCVMFMVVLGFVMLMGHGHNDSLASKGTEYAGQVLGALFLALRGVRSTGGTPPQ